MIGKKMIFYPVTNNVNRLLQNSKNGGLQLFV